ncbi:MAG: hypothetical protein QW727_01375 [Candidatus Pacearchaeota archaeon]
MVNLKAIVIGIAIMILTSFVAIYGIQTFYKEVPQWNDYCKDIRYPREEINTSSKCLAFGGKWNSYDKWDVEPTPVNNPKVTEGYCDLTYYCNQEYQEASKIYSKMFFIISVLVGVSLIAIGSVLFVLESVGVGIMLGGVITLIYGAQKYWPNAGNFGRFSISLIGLVFLIFLAYWLNKKEQKKTWLKLFKKK